MKTLSPRFWLAAATFLASYGLSHAHPGHDGHELTWDFSHLAEHPLATLGCATVLGVGGWTLVRILRRVWEVRVQSLRASQASRGI